jgi:hypothetical protein
MRFMRKNQIESTSLEQRPRVAELPPEDDDDEDGDGDEEDEDGMTLQSAPTSEGKCGCSYR